MWTWMRTEMQIHGRLLSRLNNPSSASLLLPSLHSLGRPAVLTTLCRPHPLSRTTHTFAT